MTRAELHDTFGGNRQSGISISNSAEMIHLFSDPTVSGRFGASLTDGWGRAAYSTTPVLVCGETRR